jgi:hypothetical protein
VDVSIVGTVLPAQGKEVAEETDKSNFKSLNKWLESFKNKKFVSWNICG